MKKKFFKNKTQMIVYLIIFGLFIWGFIYLGSLDYNNGKIKDNEKFYNEHKLVNIDNIFSYMNASEAYAYLKNNEDAILFIGLTNNTWVDYYANILNDVAKSLGIKKINYYDVYEDRKNSNGVYESIVKYLENYVTYLDDDTANLYGPTLIVKKDGKIILFDDDTSLIKGKNNPEDYWNNFETNLKKRTLEVVLSDYLEIIDGE